MVEIPNRPLERRYSVYFCVKRTFVLVRVCKVAGKHTNNMPKQALFTHIIDI